MRCAEARRHPGCIRSHRWIDFQYFAQRLVATEILACRRSCEDDAVGCGQCRLKITCQCVERHDPEERWVHPEKARLICLNLAATNVWRAHRRRNPGDGLYLREPAA